MGCADVHSRLKIIMKIIIIIINIIFFVTCEVVCCGSEKS